MLKNVNLAAVFTGIIIVIGLAVIMPAYYQSHYKQEPISTQKQTSVNEATATSKVILAFDINTNKNNNLPDWCNKLFFTLKNNNISAAVFISGKLVEQYPECVVTFSSNKGIDIGSETYNYLNLTSILDYPTQLEEVKNGKKAVDNAAKINSSLFKAPYGSIDQNIYSLLSRSGIVADFSYPNQYNKYENGQFIKYDLKAFNGSNSTELVNNITSSKGRYPILINFNNTNSINEIENFISNMKKDKNIDFISASELTGLNLTR